MSQEGLHAGEPVHRRWVGAVLVAAVAGVVVAAVLTIPRADSALPPIAHQALRAALPDWHTTEVVSEVVYGTRGFDTFGETFLLLAAVVSVVVLARRKEPRTGRIGEERAAEEEQAEDPGGGSRTGEEGEARAAESEEEAGSDEEEHEEEGEAPPADPDAEPVGTVGQERSVAMTVVTRTSARMAAPVLAILGFYLCAWGYTPGGGFPAGAVMLGVVLLLYAGFGYRRISKVVSPSLVEILEVAVAAVIVATQALGLVLEGSVSANWLPLAPIETIRAGGILQLFSGSELIEVATGLTLAFFAILGMRHDWSPDEDGHEEDGHEEAGHEEAGHEEAGAERS